MGEWLRLDHHIYCGACGDVPDLVPSTSNNWRGTSPTLTVRTVRHGLQPLSGTFRVALRTAGLSMTTPPLAHDVSAADMQVRCRSWSPLVR